MRRRRTWLVALIAFLVINVVFFARDPLGLRGKVDEIGKSATATLLYSVPDAFAGGDFEPLTRFDADRMNEERSGVGKRLLYVPADRVSLGPRVVSVNPIDDYTWSGASLSSDGTCYLILLLHDRKDPKQIDTRFDTSSDGSRCRGAEANPGTVRRPRWPD